MAGTQRPSVRAGYPAPKGSVLSNRPSRLTSKRWAAPPSMYSCAGDLPRIPASAGLDGHATVDDLSDERRDELMPVAAWTDDVR